MSTDIRQRDNENKMLGRFLAAKRQIYKSGLCATQSDSNKLGHARLSCALKD